MDESRMMQLGQLAEAERALREIETRADGQVLILRIRSSPVQRLADLKTDEIVGAAEALKRLQAEAGALAARIRTLRESLGVTTP